LASCLGIVVFGRRVSIFPNKLYNDFPHGVEQI